MKASMKFRVLSVIFLAPMPFVTDAADLSPQPPPTATNSVEAAELALPKSTIWQDGVGKGFLSSAQTFTLEAGVASGFAAFGGRESHDLGLLSASYGHMLSGVKGGDHWYRGNFEGRLELFGGMQYHRDVDTDGWLVGFTPHVRYNFATGSRWVPFVDLGAGVTATGLGAPDLSGTFEFNLQATTGVHWFLRDNLALTGDIRFLHVSCAGMHSPNLGMNNVAFMFGVSWFFGK
jgi:lipid A 3-O-deacylase